MQVRKYVRRQFSVEAIQVTNENMLEVAKWCKGRIRGESDSHHIKLNINRPLSERQTKAFPGDWILHSPSGFRIYTPKAFENGFELDQNAEPVEVDVEAAPREVKIHVGEAEETVNG